MVRGIPKNTRTSSEFDSAGMALRRWRIKAEDGPEWEILFYGLPYRLVTCYNKIELFTMDT